MSRKEVYDSSSIDLTEQQELFKIELEKALKSNDNGGILVLGTGGTGRRKVMGDVFRDLSLEAKSNTLSNKSGLPAIVVSVPPHYDLRDALVIILKRIAVVGEYYCRISKFKDNDSNEEKFENILANFLKENEGKKEQTVETNLLKEYIEKKYSDKVAETLLSLTGMILSFRRAMRLCDVTLIESDDQEAWQETQRKFGIGGSGQFKGEVSASLLNFITKTIGMTIGGEAEYRNDKSNGEKKSLSQQITYSPYTYSQAESSIKEVLHALSQLRKDKLIKNNVSAGTTYLVLHLEKYPVERVAELFGALRESIRLCQQELGFHTPIVVSGGFRLGRAWFSDYRGGNPESVVRPVFSQIMAAPIPWPHEIAKVLASKRGGHDDETQYILAALLSGGSFIYAETVVQELPNWLKNAGFVKPLRKAFRHFVLVGNSDLGKEEEKAAYQKTVTAQVRKLFAYELLNELYINNGSISMNDISNSDTFKNQCERRIGGDPWELLSEFISETRSLSSKGGDDAEEDKYSLYHSEHISPPINITGSNLVMPPLLYGEKSFSPRGRGKLRSGRV